MRLLVAATGSVARTFAVLASFAVGEWLGVFGESEFAAVGQLYLISAAFSRYLYDFLSGMIFLYMGGNGGRHYSGGYSTAFGCLDVFPRAVLVEFDFGASGKIDFIFGPAAPLLLFHFADIFLGIVLCNEIAGLFWEADPV